MRTLTEKYNGVLKGTYTKDHFIREARMQFPNLITQHNSYQDATRILLNKGIITENEAEKVVVKEAYGMSLEDAKAEALKTSKEEGVVQHVEETEEGSGKYRVSDFYDSDLTVVSYENGRPLNEAEKVSNPKKADLNKDGKLSDYEKKRGAAIEKAMEKQVKEIGMFMDPVGYEKPKPNPKDQVFTKKFVGTSDVKGHSGYMYDIFKNGELVKTIEGEGNANEYINQLQRGKEGDISESLQDIDQAYYDVLAVIRKHARRLNDEDAYQFHEQLKSFFNRLLESSPEEKPVQVGDVIDHKGVQKTIVRIDGHKVYLQPVSATKGGGIEIDRKLGITRDMAMRGKTLGESKETGYQVPKPELPIDVVHHGIRFELDKKGIGNTPNEEEYLKAYKLASKNISKDLLFYKKEEGAVQLPDNAIDQMTKVKLKEGIKGIIKKILSEEVSSTKKPFNAKGELL